MSHLLTVEELSALVRYTPRGVRRLVREGHLPALRLNRAGKILFDLEQVQATLKAGGTPPPAQGPKGKTS
jgi:excisionase family DNA binding protein